MSGSLQSTKREIMRRKDTRKHSERKAIADAIKDAGKCQRCGTEDDLQGHHVIPRSKAPLFASLQSNIEVLCANCHAAEHPEWGAMIARPRRRTGVMLECRHCGKPFYVKRSRAKKVHHCSKKCGELARNKKALLHRLRACEYCGNGFITHPHPESRVAKCCSYKCAAAKRRTSRAVSCEQCGKEFTVNRANPARFCSLACFGKHRSNRKKIA